MTAAPGPVRVDVTADDALGTSDATDLVARLARREVSARELREAAMARCRAADVHLNAVARWFVDPVRTEVAVRGDAPLAGIPTLLKDDEDVAGHPTSHGSLAVPDRPARRCSAFAAHYLALGVQVLGLTTMPEFGMTAATESSRFGATRNPWDTARTPGGSSGGSAALVAAGVVPIAHATDGGGSIRIPAACCGLVGLKPTRGRLPDAPALARLPVHITAPGVLTRTVRDTALFYALSERAHPPRELPPIGHVTRPGTTRLRIGLCTGAPRGLPVDGDAVTATTSAATLCSALGHHVEPVDAPASDRFLGDFLVYWGFLAFQVHHRGAALVGPGFNARRLEVFTRGLSARLVRQADRLPGALRRLRRLATDHAAALAGYDVLLSPVVGHAAPPVGYLGPDIGFREHLARLVRFASPTPAFQNVSGAPALSLPLARTSDGMPMGVQLVAPFGQERRLLHLGLELEEAAPWPATASAPGPLTPQSSVGPSRAPPSDRIPPG